MRKIVVFNRITLDGFFAGPNGEIDWFIRDTDLDKAIHGAGAAGTLIAGRLTYQMFEAVWPRMAQDPNAPPEMQATGRELNEMSKVVFSTTLKVAAWQNSVLLHGDVAGEARRLKQADGPGILIFGSGSIVRQLAAASLIDDYYLAVTPVILGEGKRMFDGVPRQSLRLVDSQSFATGNVLLHYAANPA